MHGREGIHYVFCECSALIGGASDSPIPLGGGGPPAQEADKALPRRPPLKHHTASHMDCRAPSPMLFDPISLLVDDAANEEPQELLFDFLDCLIQQQQPPPPVGTPQPGPLIAFQPAACTWLPDRCSAGQPHLCRSHALCTPAHRRNSSHASPRAGAHHLLLCGASSKSLVAAWHRPVPSTCPPRHAGSQRRGPRACPI